MTRSLPAKRLEELRTGHLNALDAAFLRGLAQATAEFARRPTEPIDVLTSAGITSVAVLRSARVPDFDIEPLRPLLRKKQLARRRAAGRRRG